MATKPCPGGGCRGVLRSPADAQIYLSDDYPDIIEGSRGVIKCPTCENEPSTEEDRISAYLYLMGIDSLPNGGLETIRTYSKSVRYLHDWQYLCGINEPHWRSQCKHPSCKGIRRFEAAEVFGLISKKEVAAAMSKLEICDYGHPGLNGVVEVARTRKRVLLEIYSQCRHGANCNKSVCSHYHDEREHRQTIAMLDDYISKLPRATPPSPLPRRLSLARSFSGTSGTRSPYRVHPSISRVTSRASSPSRDELVSEGVHSPSELSSDRMEELFSQRETVREELQLVETEMLQLSRQLNLLQRAFQTKDSARQKLEERDRSLQLEFSKLAAHSRSRMEWGVSHISPIPSPTRGLASTPPRTAPSGIPRAPVSLASSRNLGLPNSWRNPTENLSEKILRLPTTPPTY